MAATRRPHRLCPPAAVMALAMVGGTVAGHGQGVMGAAVQAAPAALVVSVGYADTLRASPLFPNPWDGAPNMTVVGPGPTYDSGAIEPSDTTRSPIAVTDVSVQIGTATFDLWGTAVTVPANGNRILAQTDGENFDSSDVGVPGCTPDGLIPTVTSTTGGTAYPHTDRTQILDTGGIDLGGTGCPPRNESHPWTLIGNPLAPSTQDGTVTPAAKELRSCTHGRCAVNGATDSAAVVGDGWSEPYGMTVTVDPSAGTATVTQAGGATVPFAQSGSTVTPPARAQATRTANQDGTDPFAELNDQWSYDLSASGQLLSETDANGYPTTCTYTGRQLTQVTDSAGRALTFAYGGRQLTAATDPLGRSVHRAYDGSGNLTSLTDAAGGVTTFADDSAQYRVRRPRRPRCSDRGHDLPPPGEQIRWRALGDVPCGGRRWRP
ncbi:MAG TPA: hypothetical protein VNN74_01840 [Candidatus Micrarchaeia archaeon]|nr:hypothetical protein [Candidatus Micrarchaeia archaeon]